MHDERGLTRRHFLTGIAITATAAAASVPAGASGWEPSLRYPDPSIKMLDPEFMRVWLPTASVERLATGFRWVEGPVWVGDGQYLLFSDIPNNKLMRWDEITGQTAVFRSPSENSNGNALDRQGRLLTCESRRRRVTRTEYSGEITVIADSFEGKRLNSPNDITCTSDGAIWFTDPPFGISSNYEGIKAMPELPDALYRITPQGELIRVLDDLAAPNGLCFTQDEKTLYVVEGRAKPNRILWAFDVSSDGSLSNKRNLIEEDGERAFDGIKCDVDGNLWCGWGNLKDPVGGDGVMIFNSEGKKIGHVSLPERCANLCFGGLMGNRLFMAAGHSIYSLYVNTKGAGLL